MDERELIAQFDLIVDAVLGGAPAPVGTDEALVRIAGALRRMPTEQFRRELAGQLAHVANSVKEEKNMAAQPTPQGYNSLMPYLVVNGASEFIEFLKTA